MSIPEAVPANGTKIRPKLAADAPSWHAFTAVARSLTGRSSASRESVNRVRDNIAKLSSGIAAYWRPAFQLSASVLCDLRTQGWTFEVNGDAIVGYPPGSACGTPGERKAQLRESHLVERDAQLSDVAVRRFVREMERQQLRGGHWQSIYSLMRDGNELADSLEQAAASGSPLRTVIDPYVQLVDADALCEHTGLRLGDIWRYFRYTWATKHYSVPGRRLQFLIRDRSAPSHPVIGIGALSSPVVQLRPRDAWIGWTPEAFLEQLQQNPSRAWARWLQKKTDELIQDIRYDDLVAAGLLRKRDLEKPTQAVIDALRSFSISERRTHQLYANRAQHKRLTNDSNDSWAELSSTPLFRAKRADTLARLLAARIALLEAGFIEPTSASLERALKSANGRRAIRGILRLVKGAHVGVDVMDITVCGAVAPYNALLGGKLVALLMASPAVTQAYNRRYRNAPSIIASAMAGRRVSRRPSLVLLGTTSLYNVAPSQYNRIRMAADEAGGSSPDELAYIRLGITEGLGSFHFSRDTMQAAERVLARADHGRRVNSIFGEGVNPKLRKVRGALDIVGLPAGAFLQHGSPRIVYAVPLATNFREVLLGRDRTPRYILPQEPEVNERIVDYWVNRWLSQRVRRPETLAQVRTHAKAYPISHGARVRLPELTSEDGPLFGASDE